MNRIDPSQITFNRVVSAIQRRVNDIPDWFFWNMPFFESRLSKSRLLATVDSQIGKRCFIIGNGPSLAGMDLSPLKNEITFGLNRIYLLFEKMDFLPTYYVCVNELVLEQFSGEIKQLKMPKFINWNRRQLFDFNNPSIIPVRVSLLDGFNTDPFRAFYGGGTVTYVALQIAYLMGFSEVILIGLDHSFVDKGIPNKVEFRESEQDANHFHPNYFPKGTKWQLPDLKRSELAYERARRKFENNGRRIIDATVNGKCLQFKKKNYSTLF
jgi:hypothetical protein